MGGEPTTLRDFCLRVLECGDLETKLAPPRQPDGSPLCDDVPGPAAQVDRPARDPALALR